MNTKESSANTYYITEGESIHWVNDAINTNENCELDNMTILKVLEIIIKVNRLKVKIMVLHQI